MRQPNGWLGNGSAKKERRGLRWEWRAKRMLPRGCWGGWGQRKHGSLVRQREIQDSHKDEEREAGMAFGFGRKTKRERERGKRVSLGILRERGGM